MLQDIRFAIRGASRTPGFTLVVVLTLALGVAVNNTVFTIVNTALLRDLPFERPDRLVSLGTRDDRGRTAGVSYPDLLSWRQTSRTLTGIAAFTAATGSLSDGAHSPERIRAAYISANTLHLLGRRPILGRDFRPDDEATGAEAVAIIGHALWQNRYGSDPAVLGRTVRVNDRVVVIIGVMPAGFTFPFVATDLWQPLSALSSIVTSARDARSRLNTFARLADGVTVEQAQAELTTITNQLAEAFPGTNENISPTIAVMSNGMPRGSYGVLIPLIVAVGFVLVMACANVANLLLSRSVDRSRELAIRASIGASRWRIVQQLLIEATLFGLMAGVLGLGLSVYGVKLLGMAFNAREAGQPAAEAAAPYWVDLSMNWPVFLFVAGVSLVAGLTSGILPALHVSKTDVSKLLKEGGRGLAGGAPTRGWTDAFLVVQLALALMLLTGAGLMLRSFVTLYRADRGIDTAGLLTARLALPIEKYTTAEQRRIFFRRLTEQLGSNATFSTTSIASDIPFMRLSTRRQLQLEGDAGNTRPSVSYVHADQNYFAALGLSIVRGRAFESADGSVGREYAIVNRRFVEQFFPNRDPIGARIELLEANVANASPVSFTVVGVSHNVPQSVSPVESTNVPSVVYVPLVTPDSPRVVSMLVRSRVPFAAAVQQLREEVSAVDPHLAIYYTQTMEQVFADERWGLRILGSWSGILALIALTLASVGLYAMAAHAVARRTQEIGIRMALGAETREVLWLFLRRNLAQLAIGLGLGIAGALAIGQVLQNLVLGTNPRDPLTLVLVTLLLTVVALGATIIPARRAARVDPLVALRYE